MNPSNLFLVPFFIIKQTPSPGPKAEPCSSSASTPSATATTTTAAMTTTTTSSSAQLQRRGRKPDHDDISQEQVLRIYHDELAKMMSGNFNPNHPAAAAFGNPAALSRSMAAASNLRDYNR